MSTLQPGDRILILNLSERGGTGKVRSYREPVVHTIINSMEENPVTYTLQIENDSKGKTRLLHRNLLLLCNSLLDHFDLDLNLEKA